MPVPAPPTDISTTVDDAAGAVGLTWTKPAGEVTGYEVVTLPTRTLYAVADNQVTVKDLEPGLTYTFEVTALNADGRSDPAEPRPRVVMGTKAVARLWRVTSFLFVVLFLVLVGVAVAGSLWWDPAWRSLLLAFALLLVVSTVLTFLDRSYGMWRAIIGADRRVSTSQLQTFLWTLLIAFMLVYFAGRSWFDGRADLFEGFLPGSTDNATPVWDDYLILLGGPFAALVAVRGILASKVQTGTVQKSVADDGTANIKQVLTNDAGNVDLIDTQYFIFNVVALAYVIIGLASKDQLPAIPGLLLALTGSAAAAYVFNKSVQNNAPAITSLMPSTARPGEEIVISGTNFRPPGISGQPTVSIGGRQALVEASSTSGRLVARVPLGVPAGGQDVVVTSAIQVATAAARMTVQADKPVILGAEPPAPPVGGQFALDGTGFLSAQDGVTSVSVRFGTIPVLADVIRLSSGVDRADVQVPATLTPNTEVEVTVQTARLTVSDPVRLTFS